MRVILDTNVLVSGIFFGGKPLEILRAWQKKRFRLVISHDILEEYLGIVEGLAARYPSTNAIEKVKTIAANAEMTLSLALSEQVCEDPDDDIFLSAALASKTKVIVSGDRLLRKVSGWRGIRVLTPSLFISEFLSK